ncbi:MAG: hypothetical protein FWD65_00365 [Coriobacteriia bacterium]|nr:hypothetical protein [Coriobacteriia bacterium]
MSEELRRCGQRLLALQDLDGRRRQAAEAIETLPQKRTVMALRAKQEEGVQRTALIDGRIAEARGREKALSDSLAIVEDKIAAEQARIDATTDHREVSALTQELDTLAKRKDALETESLEFLQAQQDLENLRTDTEEKIAALASREQSEIASYREQAARLKAELSELDAQRATITAALSADLLARYDALVEEKGGVAVARFEKGHCLGCSIVPPTGERARIEASDEIEACPHCRRLLVVE